MLPRNGTYEIINVATGSYFDLRGSSIAPDTNIIGFPRTGGANQKVKQFTVHILVQAYIDTWFAVDPRKRRRQHRYLAQPFISRSGCRRQGPCSCPFSLNANIRELSQLSHRVAKLSFVIDVNGMNSLWNELDCTGE